MNVEIGAEAALFPEKEYINGIPLQCRLYFRLEFSGFKPLPDSSEARTFLILPKKLIGANLTSNIDYFKNNISTCPPNLFFF